jgi:hypothetical protein
MTNPKKDDDAGFKLFTRPLDKPRVLTCPQAVVIYTLAHDDDPIALLKHHLSPDALDQKIREILAANPKIDFTPKLQSALGITIISIQRTPQSQPSSNEWGVGF